MSLLPRSERRLRQEAKTLSSKENIPHTAALDRVAQSHGYSSWKFFRASLNESIITPPPQDAADNSFLELADAVKIKVAKNKAYIASFGIEYSIFEPTITGLKKSIIDATQAVRHHFELEKFHYFEQQKQGPVYKVIKKAHFVSNDFITSTNVSLYRPETKLGDPRMWFSKLPDFVNSGDQIAIVVFEDELYLFNFSRVSLESITPESFIAKLLDRFARRKNNVAAELLRKLKEIAKKPIVSKIKGDTAVGMAVEHALNISANSNKNPDFMGIELKSGRGGKNRTTLFAQVADWGISPCKSSADILNRYGYQRDVDFKLYCTVSTLKANSQGLQLHYDEPSDQLIEKDGNGNNVAIWPGKLLRDRLIQKHAETFWINATSSTINGIEYFELISVTHTKRPLESQLLPLIQSGVITMDHLIKRKGAEKTSVAEKGPLFKLNKRDLSLLFPEPKTYSLRKG